MRIYAVVLFSILSLSGPVIATPDQQATRTDTLAIAPGDLGDLSAAVVSWLEAREMLIPLSWEECFPETYADSNTVAGTFIAEGQSDVAVLAISRGAINDSCSLWVFPANDTLAPMLVEKFRAGSEEWPVPWAPVQGNDSQLGYYWRIESFSAKEYIDTWKRLTYDSEWKRLAVDSDSLPESIPGGIRLWLIDKPGGNYFFYDGKKWIRKNFNVGS